MAYVTKREP